MIEQIKYSVRFPPNDRFPAGQAFERELNFGKGATNIVGPNEVGKSLNYEMIEFLLFGSKALRGIADDYGNFRAEGVFQIRGQRCAITRSLRNAALTLDGAASPSVVGTKPVNARIIALLGYGLDVFRVANAANQGDSERLSQMLPSERKAMVDKLIGTQQVEALARWCGEEALGVSREISGLERGLGEEPVKPSKPAGYRPVKDARKRVDELREKSDRAIELRAFLANPPAVPELPEIPTQIPLATLDKAIQILGLRTYDFDLAELEAHHAGYEAWQGRQRFEQRYMPQPKIPLDLVQTLERGERLERELAGLKRTPTILCPCGKPFTTADAEIARVQEALGHVPVKPPGIDLDVERRANARWTPEVSLEWLAIQGVPEHERPVRSLSEAKGAVHVDDQRAAIRELGIDPETGIEELRALAAQVRAYEATVTARDRLVAVRERWDAQAAEATVELAGINVVGLADAEQTLREAEAYETRLQAYTESFARWAEGRDRLTDLRREETSWRNGRLALNQIREEAKTFIVPALSRVASVILAEMTGGQRSRVVIDEDFEIEVDGQRLNTLSGSGKVCANLAIRFGLGRVLTNDVFSVFLGDEVDSSMDGDRAESLHEALFNLRHRINQIIVITHKAPTFDQVLRLES